MMSMQDDQDEKKQQASRRWHGYHAFSHIYF